MPGGDRTGPTGAGPMTGRQAGVCNGFDRPGFANGKRGQVGGRGQGKGGFRGNGNQRRNQRYAAGQTGWRAPYSGGRPSAESTSEIASLKDQAQQLSSVLANLERRIMELEGVSRAAGDTTTETER